MRQHKWASLFTRSSVPRSRSQKVDGSVAYGWRLLGRMAGSTLLRWLIWSQGRKRGRKARMGVMTGRMWRA